MLQFQLLRFRKSGFNEVIINVHHQAEKIIRYLREKKDFGMNITISHEKEGLLDTGGGMKKASWFFDDGRPFLAHNVDVVSNMDLNRFMEFHASRDALATLAVRERESRRYLLFDPDTMTLAGWRNVATGEEKIPVQVACPKRLAFSGIHIADPRVFFATDMSGRFSLVDLWLSLAKDHKICGYLHNDDLWADVGTPKKLEYVRDLPDGLLHDMR